MGSDFDIDDIRVDQKPVLFVNENNNNGNVLSNNNQSIYACSTACAVGYWDGISLKLITGKKYED